MSAPLSIDNSVPALVNTATGEITGEMSTIVDTPLVNSAEVTAAAERRAERITLRLDAIADNYRAVLPMIREAVEKRDDIALGYRSPGEYVSDRFGQSLAGLGIDVRRAVVQELTQAGMSTRAIAPVVGVGSTTVKRDRQVVQVDHLAPGDDGELSGGQNWPPESGSIDPTPVAPVAPAPVVGIDGKTYARPAPKPPADEWDEEREADEMSASLARGLVILTAATVPERRAEFIAAWPVANRYLEVSGSVLVTPSNMRAVADGLRNLANEWEQANV